VEVVGYWVVVVRLDVEDHFDDLGSGGSCLHFPFGSSVKSRELACLPVPSISSVRLLSQPQSSNPRTSKSQPKCQRKSVVSQLST
jgi:hypothetical protein